MMSFSSDPSLRFVSFRMTMGVILFFLLTCANAFTQPSSKHNLHFEGLAKTWDEGIPLGNATLGALIWEKDHQLRFSLDRSDLWDLRPMKGLDVAEFSYKWIAEHVKNKDYKIVQQKLDAPYEEEPAPSKIPAAALMINTKSWGDVEYVNLNISTAVCVIRWKNGTKLETFVHATKPVGWFRISDLSEEFNPRIEPPAYQSKTVSGSGSVEGDDLNRLGYEQGEVSTGKNKIIYRQKGWNGFSYVVTIDFKKTNPKTIEGHWDIFSFANGADYVKVQPRAKTYKDDYDEHSKWWKNFWSKSSLHVPDEQLEKQWYLELYKFGSTARKDAPPISLQAVWTADNGRLPPWKGDFHHDLNTQLSYWPSYSANHLEESMGYLNHLDNNKQNYRRYTKKFFGVDGLNVPGVTTLDGTEMGGWIQYSGSPTISSWLAQHYYLQWRYSMDINFLRTRAYPWISETARFIENITQKDANGYRQLPISSSPEIFDNRMEAWFPQNTNYDLALMKFVFHIASETAMSLNKTDEANRWMRLSKEFSDYSIDDNKVMMFAPGKPYDESHRHFSNVMAIHPLGLIKWEDGPQAQAIIKNSIRALDSVGPSLWCGYSYSWLANLKARAKDGDGAAKALEIFSKAFCLKNSFHVNGDQTKSGYSNFTYRPFTLEGNFAFAAGLQEMLLQSYAGFIEVFPAVPAEWKDISFNTLRAEGGILVSAKKENGKITSISISSEKAGKTILKLPGRNFTISQKDGLKNLKQNGEYLELVFNKGGSVTLRADFVTGINF
jgi:alpha-L-fucosidase 2